MWRQFCSPVVHFRMMSIHWIHRLSALERRNLDLEKQNRELEKLNQEMLQAKENISSRVDGMDQTRRSEELELREQYAGLAAQLQRQQETSQMLSGRLEEIEYLLEKKLTGFEENQVKNGERMDRLAMDTARRAKTHRYDRPNT